MVVSLPASRPGNGPRPVNLNKDIPQLIDLLQLVFGEQVEIDGQRLFTNSQSSRKPALFWRLTPTMTRLAPGFVWEVDGRIVGNATLLPTKSPRRYLIANVAVHPDFRRMGIARGLMHQALNAVRQRRGRTVLLQVVKDNTPAIALYKSLDFVDLGSMTTWRASVSRLRDLIVLPDDDRPGEVRPLSGSRWREAYKFDRLCLHPDLRWPEPLQPNTYKQGLWRSIRNFFSGRQMETWTIDDRSGRLVALGSIESEWGRSHQVNIRVHPAWHGRLERPMLAKLVRRLHYLPRRNVRLEHPDDDQVMNELLPQANFHAQRTLTHMRLDLE